jgi:hypothetical protein
LGTGGLAGTHAFLVGHMKDFKFRAYSASLSSVSVAKELSQDYVPYMVVSRNFDNDTFWYLLDVDDELLAKLRKNYRSSLEYSLDLHKSRGHGRVILDDASKIGPVIQKLRSQAAPKILLNNAGGVYGFFDPAVTHSVPTNQVFANMSCEKNCVEPDREMEFNVAITGTPQLGAGTSFLLDFPKDKEKIEVHAEVTSTDFSRPDGTVWYQSFTIDRELNCAPASWMFKARPVGGRPRYSLSVEFSAEGSVLGSIVTTLPLCGQGDIPVSLGAGGLTLPSESGARLQVRWTQQAGGSVEFYVSIDGERNTDPIPSAVDVSAFDGYFYQLEQAKSLERIEQLAFSLTQDLPDELQEILTRHPCETTLFSGEVPLAPFELLQLRPNENGPLLGIERPVSRWVSSAQMGSERNLKISRAACIRPVYKEALPSAEHEEELLQTRFKDRLTIVRSKTEFDALLQTNDISLLHFAGHADGNPAYLILEDDQVNPGSFRPYNPLLKERKPFFFINGCGTAKGSRKAPSIVGNFAKALLRSGFSSIVAPHINVNSQAALRAAEAFYTAALSGDSVDAALQKIRELAIKDDTPDDQRASLLSYLAFTPADLKLNAG